MLVSNVSLLEVCKLTIFDRSFLFFLWQKKHILPEHNELKFSAGEISVGDSDDLLISSKADASAGFWSSRFSHTSVTL